MLPARRFWSNLSAAVLSLGMQFFIMFIFFAGYVPTYGTQPFDIQFTIVVSLITGAVYFAGEIAMIVVSIRYERPSRQRED